MNRNYERVMVYLITVVLLSLLLIWRLSLLNIAYAVSPPPLPRDFALPIPLFASSSAWNQIATTAAVLPDSDQQIFITYRVLRGDTTDLQPPGPPPTTWPFMYVNYDEYAKPIFRAGAREQSVLLCDYEGNKSWPSPKFSGDPQEGGPVTVPAPVGTVRPAGPQDTDADGHLVLYDPNTFTAYDFWQATTVRDAECESRGGGLTGTVILEAGVVDFFDVRGSGTNPDTYSSARATGTPLLAGLILPEDVESGTIAHALAFAIPGPRNLSDNPSEPLSSDYFYPASTTETDFYSTNSEPVITTTIYLPLILKNFTAPLTPTSSPTPAPSLSTVNDFLYQLQNLDLTAVGNTAYDLVVMDYSADGSDAGAFTAAQIVTLTHSPGGEKIIISYMSIGEAEDYRFYWQDGWTPGNPAWLDAENPDWAGNYKVHYWDAAWQAIIFSYTDRLLDAGFDGAYLDIIDAYEYYADQGHANAAQEMADFVAAIRAHARTRDSDFYIFPQNAPELAEEVAGYLNNVDGIGQEDIYYGYDDDDVMTPPAVTTELEGYLDLFKNAGKLVLTVDYATTPAHVNDAYTKSQAKGYVPFVTVRNLDQLTINFGHEPD